MPGELVVQPMPVTVRAGTWEVLAEEEITVGATAIGITPALLTNPVKTVARLTVTTGAVRVRMLADPTSTVGISIPNLTQFEVTGPNDLRTMRMVQESVGSKVFVQLGRL